MEKNKSGTRDDGDAAWKNPAKRTRVESSEKTTETIGEITGLMPEKADKRRLLSLNCGHRNLASWFSAVKNRVPEKRL
ncbi:MAG: hypothetical protein MUC65_03895 [Pontiellaceae bacterium]|nr:hypothetical protein [Pontiellaceae bacterium]